MIAILFLSWVPERRAARQIAEAVASIGGSLRGDASPMDDENIECRWFSGRELERMIRGGKIVDAKTLIGLLLKGTA